MNSCQRLQFPCGEFPALSQFILPCSPISLHPTTFLPMHLLPLPFPLPIVSPSSPIINFTPLYSPHPYFTPLYSPFLSLSPHSTGFSTHPIVFFHFHFLHTNPTFHHSLQAFVPCTAAWWIPPPLPTEPSIAIYKSPIPTFTFPWPAGRDFTIMSWLLGTHTVLPGMLWDLLWHCFSSFEALPPPLNFLAYGNIFSIAFHLLSSNQKILEICITFLQFNTKHGEQESMKLQVDVVPPLQPEVEQSHFSIVLPH